jgi:signal transduction histidine kinase
MTETTPLSSDDQRSFQQLLERYERIIEISQQLNSTLDHSHLLRKIVNASQELTNTEAASILLIDPISGELRFEYASNIKSNEMEKIVVPMEGSIAGWTVTHGEARVIQDVTREPHFFKRVDDTIQFQTRNLLAVPMRAHDKVIGVLEAVNKRDGERFSDDDIKTLMTLASQAAVAIENTRLFQQSDFMSEMVHELRTPLAALKTSTSLLLRPELGEARRTDLIRTMQSETERLIQMTSDFLDLARWESGRARLEPKPFDLRKLLIECVDVVRSQADERGILMQIDGDLFTVNGDRGKIKQVVLNLLTNAIKYNRDNGQVFIRTMPTTQNGDPYAELVVIDTGYGISAESQRHMFQKFYRAAETAGNTAGTGLGLAITKHIVEAHNGEIWLISESGKGSEFHITLPCVE